MDSTGETAEIGDMAVVHLSFQNEKDTFNTIKRGSPIQIPVKSAFEGSLEEGLTLLSEGDSAVFKINNDSLYTMFKDSLPAEIKPGSYTDFHVKVVKIYTQAEMQKEQEAQMKQEEEQQKQAFAQLEKDTLAIKELLAGKGIKNAKRTENGVYYVVHKKGTGAKITQGDSVTVHYTGRLTDGKEFDSSKGKAPFVFIAGMSQVIFGWHELILNLNEGDKVTAYIPSILGYGPYGSAPTIPPDANLIFDIEVVKVQKFKGMR